MVASTIKYDGGLTLSLQVSDLEKAITWYEDILGFKLLYRLDEQTFYDPDGNSLMLYQDLSGSS